MWTNGKKWLQLEVSGGNWFTKAQNPLRIAVCRTALKNVWFAKAKRVQHRVYKFTTLTVTYLENCAYLLLISKAICVNVQNLSYTQIMSLQTKLIGCANSVAKSVEVWLTWRVTYEHIQFKEGLGKGRRHEIKEVVTLKTERTAIMYVCMYVPIARHWQDVAQSQF